MARTIWASLDPFFEGGAVLGRRVANEQFLRFLLRADPCDEYRFYLADEGRRTALAARLDEEAPAPRREGRIRILDARALPRALGEDRHHCFHLSDCIRAQPHLARLRNLHSAHLFPLTGVTHSLSYAEYPPAFLAHLWPGTTARDAIVCTSRAGRRVVAGYFETLRAAYGLDEERCPAPELAQIPLGVDADEFPSVKRRGRKGPPTVLVLGRLSHHSKMDLLPLLRAMGRAMGRTGEGRGARLVLAGWVDDGDDLPATLAALAANLGIDLHIEARPDEAAKHRLLAEADVFVSIADNPQETFGITILEAMAAGLPVIASDYDGYRDLVAHEDTGLLIPTTGPDRTPELDALAAILPGNQYHLLLAQQTAVDVPALAEALERLTGDADLRLRMGAASRARVAERYTWPTVIERYAALWERLAATPVIPEAERRARRAAHPLHAPFGPLFAHYATRALAPNLRLAAGVTGRAIYRHKDRPVIYAGLDHTLDPEAIAKLAFFARAPLEAADLEQRLCAAFPALTPEAARAHLLWALKNDVLEIAFASPDGEPA